MKRLVSLLLIFSFLVHLAGAHVYFILRLYEIHMETRAQLKQLPIDQLQVLKMSLLEFEDAQVEEDEIEVEDKMYDVARIEKSGNEITVYCLHDQAEDNLLSFLDEILKKASHDKKPLPLNFLDLLEASDLPVPFKFIHVDKSALPFFISDFISYKDPISSLTTPPPKQFSL